MNQSNSEKNIKICEEDNLDKIQNEYKKMAEEDIDTEDTSNKTNNKDININQEENLNSDEKTDTNAKPYLTNIHELPKDHEFTLYNKYIINGYRVNFNTPGKIFKSIFMCHNESFNVWSHLSGVIFALVLMVLIFFTLTKFDLIYYFSKYSGIIYTQHEIGADGKITYNNNEIQNPLNKYNYKYTNQTEKNIILINRYSSNMRIKDQENTNRNFDNINKSIDLLIINTDQKENLEMIKQALSINNLKGYFTSDSPDQEKLKALQTKFYKQIALM